MSTFVLASIIGAKAKIKNFETVNDLKGIIAGCTRDNNVKRLKAITENYLMSDTYRVPENWIFENYKFLFE